MIVGNGLIASLFKENYRSDVVFFASGVSNSLEKNESQFEREENLIKDTLAEESDKIFVYFSTCSIYDSSKNGSSYVLHKLKMEQLVKNSAKEFLILRVSNAVGKGGNPNLLINYLIRSAKEENTINVHTKASRNLIDAEDVKNITEKLLNENYLNKIVNLAYLHNYSVVEILEIIERFYHKKLDLNLVKSGSGYDINIPETENYFRENNLTSKDDYFMNILQKYYA
ncbi:NAD-dependent epimerase/dehydratase family protein [Halpernia frigidisoli]|uniref:dTDP-4-dehydrorhamnose reductase n=1 Tax=Halpernia frigidisoli TaxID=1125876 RepID=A0A1I3GLU2_9FLAO|nr:NAD-dependent epimerase/dehydratase family protein [Halpernia frigidisoli]SFI24429.1 dTDP-4-dehydrorhamnose reductase [Halpernia frigidisoli]